MTIVRVLLSTVMLASFAPWLSADAPIDAKAEIKKLEGRWQVTKFVDRSEKPAAAEEIEHFTFEFKSDHFILRRDKDATGKKYKFRLVPAKKHQGIDVDFAFMVSQGIYKLEGDKLSLCLISGSRSGKTAARPTEFKPSKEHKYTLFVLKRIKK